MATESRFLPDDPLEALVAGALAGHGAAWDALVERLQRVVWKAVNMMTFDREIRDDAFAATWLRLAERLDSIREPEKLPGWMTTTATNEVRQIVRQRQRHPTESTDALSGPDGSTTMIDRLAGDAGEHVDGLLGREERQRVRTAFGHLDETCRELITILVLADPPVPYDEASGILGRPVGSLGPSRRRCLDKMKTLLDHATEDSHE